MSMKTKRVSRVLCGLLCAGLLCGFAAPPAEENADLVPRQFQTAQQIDRISVEDAISNVTIRTTDTDHITVDYADTTENPLYTISVEDGLLSIHTTTEEFEETSISLIQIDSKTVSEHPNHDLVVTLPQKQYQELSVALAVGTFSVEGVKASRPCALSDRRVCQYRTDPEPGKVGGHHPQPGNLFFYQELILSGRLHTILIDLDGQVTERCRLVVQQMAHAEGITEELKASNPMYGV